MEKEILACIDDYNVKFLQSGQISKYVFPMERKEAHQKKISHLISRFFILAISPEGKIKYLVQKRGKNKSTYPGYFTDSASGFFFSNFSGPMLHILLRSDAVVRACPT